MSVIGTPLVASEARSCLRGNVSEEGFRTQIARQLGGTQRSGVSEKSGPKDMGVTKEDVTSSFVTSRLLSALLPHSTSLPGFLQFS